MNKQQAQQGQVNMKNNQQQQHLQGVNHDQVVRSSCPAQPGDQFAEQARRLRRLCHRPWICLLHILAWLAIPAGEKYSKSLFRKVILKALASVLSTHYKSTDMSDIHLLVKRRLAALHLGRLPHPVIIATNCILSPREGGGQAGGRGEVESAEQAALLKASQRQGLDL